MQAILLDGSNAGGQMLRLALAFSCLLQKPFKIINIRKKRPRSGLSHQHLLAVKTCQQLTNAVVDGATLGSTELLFVPKTKKWQSQTLVMPTAGSITLLLQSLLYPYLFGKRSITFTIEGGTDVPWSIPSDYWQFVLCFNLRNYATLTSTLVKRGFYPQGKGQIVFKIKPHYEHWQEAPPLMLGTVKEIYSYKILLFTTKKYSHKASKVGEILRLSLQQKHPAVQLSVQETEALDDAWGVVIQINGSDGSQQFRIGIDALYGTHNHEEQPEQLAQELLQQIQHQETIDEHFADMALPLLGLIGGKIITKEFTDHMKAAHRVTEAFTEKTIALKKEGKFFLFEA